MRKFEKVKYTKPFELFFLIVSTITLFIGTIFILNRLISTGFLKFILALSIAVIYFLLIKIYFIVKETDFELTENQLKWDNESIEFENIEYYKIHWLKGAGIKFKLKNGKVVRLSSNENFCDSEKFVNLCHTIDNNLRKFNDNKILRKNSFFETKNGYYFAIIMSFLVVLAIVFKVITKGELNIGNLGIILFSLGTIWSGVTWKRK